MSIPSHPDQVTPSWLTSRLNRAGLAGTVSEISWQNIGAGQLGENARFHIAGHGDLPPTLVGKFPSTNPLSRHLAVQLSNYAREVFFYAELGRTVDIQTPRCFAAEFDPDTHDFVLLMEDLAPGVQIDQMSECNIDQAALALEELGKLHGPRWGDAQLADLPLLAPSQLDDGEESAHPLLFAAFMQRYGDRLSADQVAAVNRFEEGYPAYGKVEAPETVIHIDYRLDNMMFGGPHPLTVFDWQSVNRGNPWVDVSYFMGTSISPERRAGNERQLLNHYFEVLRSYGVTLDWDQCWTLYRHYAPAGLNMAVLVSTLVAETERGNDMFMAMATRSIRMCRDLDAFELLGRS